MTGIRLRRSQRRLAVRSAIAVLAAILAGGLAGAGSASGQQPGGEALARSLPASGGLSVASVPDKVSPRLADATGTVTAFVELEKTAAIDAFTAQQRNGADKEHSKQAANQAKDDVQNTVNSVIGQLLGRDRQTKEIYRAVNAVAGLLVTSDAANLRALAARPDVRSVRTSVPKTLSNAYAVQFTKTLNAWQQTGKFGDNVRIGIIDDGIDYTHADFGGPGTKAAYNAIDHTKVDPSYFPTNKVVGGYDFAGDDYDASGAHGSPTPKPDPNPISCGHHGTHVAGSAAGFGVNDNGSTFTGDYAKLTPDALNAMKVGPGTAPKAKLYALKVFGCSGSTNLVGAAMDWALNPSGNGDFSDHLDVVNLSLGSNFAAPDDPDNLFVHKLAEQGVLAVIAAGNSGDLYDAAGAPGNATDALSVASVRDGHSLLDGAQVIAPSDLLGAKAGQYSQNYTGYDSLDLTKPVVPLSATANKDGCGPFSAADKAAVAGKFAWLEWDDNDSTRRCGSAVRANNAGAAGAVGVVLSSSVDVFGAGIAGNATVPMFQLTGSNTKPLRPALAAGTLQMRFAGALRTSISTLDPALADTASSFTSRGVRGPSVKPDVAAPGDGIASALSGSGNNVAVFSGTSMATPHTTGIAALLLQTHPDWTPEEVKAAVMNTADADVKTAVNGTVYGPQRVGAGRVDAGAALKNEVLALSADDPGAVGVSFGAVDVSHPLAVSKTVKVINKGSRPVELNASYQALTTMPGVDYKLSTNTVRLPGGAMTALRVTLKIDDPTALRKVIDPTMQSTQLGVARQFVADASGRLVLTPTKGSTVPLRVPVYSAPKPAATIITPPSLRFSGIDTQAVLHLLGRGVDQGQGSQAYRSLVSVMELQATHDRLPQCTKEIVTGCTINDTARAGNLRYVGAASTAPLAKAQGSPDTALLAFGVVSWGNWANIGSNTVPFVDIRLDGHDTPDYEVYVTKPAGSDVLVAATVDLHKPRPGGGFAVVDLEPVNGQFGDVDTNVFDTNVIVLPVLLKAIGIDPTKGSARLAYTVGVAGYYTAPGSTNGVIDEITTPMSYDPLAPGLWVQAAGAPALSYLAMPGTALMVNRNPVSLAADGADSLLVLNHHNASGHRATVVTVDSDESGGGGYQLPDWIARQPVGVRRQG